MGDTVWSAMVGAFQNASGELADRLLAAMEAAENEGGDLRGKQAASLIVVPGKASGVPQLDRSIDLRVDDHTEPVGEIRRLLSYSRAHERANHATEKAMANELPAALAELDTCCAAYPQRTRISVSPGTGSADAWANKSGAGGITAGRRHSSRMERTLAALC